jgi:hypothetical protein
LKHHPDDILLTGVPRSGTTLCCTLLNRNPRVLALVEPMRIPDFVPEDGAEAACERIARFLAETRARALREGKAPSLQRDGVIVDNPMGPTAGDSTRRPRVVRIGEVALDRALPADFRLVIKHNALFTALLPELSRRFTIYAVVRDPLAVLASWNSVDLPVRDGHVPAGELYDTALREALAAEPERITRQLRVLDWFFERILRHVPQEQIIRYEELVSGASQPATALGVPRPVAEQAQNRNREYPQPLLESLAGRLPMHPGAWRKMYAVST